MPVVPASPASPRARPNQRNPESCSLALLLVSTSTALSHVMTTRPTMRILMMVVSGGSCCWCRTPDQFSSPLGAQQCLSSRLVLGWLRTWTSGSDVKATWNRSTRAIQTQPGSVCRNHNNLHNPQPFLQFVASKGIDSDQSSMPYRSKRGSASSESNEQGMWL